MENRVDSNKALLKDANGGGGRMAPSDPQRRCGCAARLCERSCLLRTHPTRTRKRQHRHGSGNLEKTETGDECSTVKKRKKRKKEKKKEESAKTRGAAD